MRCSTVVTACLLAIPLIASLFGFLESVSFLRPAKLHLSKFTETDTHLDKPLPPLLAALYTKVREWERPSSVSKYVPISDTANYTLLVSSTNHTIELLAVDNVQAKGEIHLYRFPVVKEWIITGKHWEQIWKLELPGEISAWAVCSDSSCFCVAYRSELGTRVRYFPGIQKQIYDDFELPGAGMLQALTASNTSIGFHRDLDLQPFTVLSLLPIYDIEEHEIVILLKEDSAWVLGGGRVQGLLENSTDSAVIGLQYVYAIEADWMIVTSTTPPGPDSSLAYLYNHLYYSVNHSEWLQFSNFHHNMTFPAQIPAHCSYSISEPLNSSMSAGVSLVASSHSFLSYSWQ